MISRRDLGVRGASSLSLLALAEMLPNLPDDTVPPW